MPSVDKEFDPSSNMYMMSADETQFQLVTFLSNYISDTNMINYFTDLPFLIRFAKEVF